MSMGEDLGEIVPQTPHFVCVRPPRFVEKFGSKFVILQTAVGGVLHILRVIHTA